MISIIVIIIFIIDIVIILVIVSIIIITSQGDFHHFVPGLSPSSDYNHPCPHSCHKYTDSGDHWKDQRARLFDGDAGENNF